MKTMTKVVVAGCLALFAVGCSKGSVEGKYSMDKAAMKAELQKQIDKLKPEEKPMAQMAMAMMDAVQMDLELQKEGKLVFTTTVPSLGGDSNKPKVETKDGSWKLQDKKLILTVPGEKELSCDHDGGKSFKCTDKDMSIVFVKA